MWLGVCEEGGKPSSHTPTNTESIRECITYVVLPDPIRPVTQAHEASVTFGGHCVEYHMTDARSSGPQNPIEGPGSSERDRS